MELLKFKHIRTKMLAGLLPIVVITVSLLTIISLNTSYKIIDEQITEQMDARLNSEASNIEAVISEIENTSMAISRMVTGTYTETEIDEFLEALSLVIYDNDYVLGSGLWFEPYAFDSKKEYCGPYVYKEGNKAVTTWDYSNAEYNYLNQEYYTMVRNSSKPKITDPYYDPTSSTVMSSTSAPIFDINHNFIGCVTVDMELSSVQSMVSDITVGKTGSAILVDSKGFYLYDKDKSKVSSSMNIKNDSNRTLAEGAGKIFQKNQGIFTYTNNKKVYDVYYKMIPQTGWYLLIQIPLDELNASVYTMRHFMIAICCLAIAVVVGVILVLVNSIVKPILTTMNFTRELSEGSGDLTYQIDISSKNEIGQLVTHFNKFIASQRTMINDLKASEDSLGKLSRQLSSSSQESASAIAQIMANIEGVRHQTAQQQETFQIVSNLLETNISKIANLDQLIIQESNGISNSSSAIEEMIGNINSVTASVERMADKYKELTVVAEDGKNLQNDVGIKINSMAEQSKTLIEANNTISSVAAQTNLLAMNAAIEAAHAGEAGKGFSVVADEIRKLAENTTKQSHAIGEQIKNITLIIDEVVSSSGGAQKSFATIKERINEVSNLVHEISNAMAEQSEASKQVLESLSDMTNSSSVVKSTATELQNDSLRIQSSLEDLVQVVQTVNSSMDEMAIGAKDINDSAQNIADMTRETNGNIDYLHGLVKKFKTE